jgi:hypothetical protein
MAEMFETPGPDRSLVRINKLQRGYTWSVVVTADDNSDEALQQAQDRAVDMAQQLEQRMKKTASDSVVPF